LLAEGRAAGFFSEYAPAAVFQEDAAILPLRLKSVLKAHDANQMAKCLGIAVLLGMHHGQHAGLSMALVLLLERLRIR
jgi:hypothetical protein